MDKDGKEVVTWALRHALILKCFVCIGLLSAYVLPAEWAVMANVASAGANMLWLWKL